MSLAVRENIRRAEARDRVELIALVALWLESLPGKWSGSASELCGELRELFPGELMLIPLPKMIATALDEMAEELDGLGWKLERARTATIREIRLSRFPD